MPAYIEFRRNFLRGFLCISERLSKAHIIKAKGNSIEPYYLLMVNFFYEYGIISGNVYVINMAAMYLLKANNKSYNAIFEY